MKTQRLAGALAALLIGVSSIVGQGTTAFTYQGRLNLNGTPANGPFDLCFELFEVPTGGGSRIDPFEANNVPVSNGLFVARIDFVDADGVALAAIQGLNEKVEARSERAEVRTRELEQRLELKETEITELKERLETLEKTIRRQNPK